MQMDYWNVSLVSTEKYGAAVMITFPGGHFTLKDFSPDKVTVDNETCGPEFNRAIYRHPLKHGGDFIASYFEQLGVISYYSLMIGQESVFIHNIPPDVFDRLRMILCGLLTEEILDSMI